MTSTTNWLSKHPVGNCFPMVLKAVVAKIKSPNSERCWTVSRCVSLGIRSNSPLTQSTHVSTPQVEDPRIDIAFLPNNHEDAGSKYDTKCGHCFLVRSPRGCYVIQFLCVRLDETAVDPPNGLGNNRSLLIGLTTRDAYAVRHGHRIMIRVGMSTSVT